MLRRGYCSYCGGQAHRTPCMESSKNKKYGDLKILLINSMTQGITVILWARPPYTLSCTSASLNVPRTRTSKQQCVTRSTRLWLSTNITSLPMSCQYLEQMASLRIWPLAGNAGAVVTDPRCVQKPKIKVSKVCKSCSRKASAPHLQDDLLSLNAYLLKPDPFSILYEIINY